MSLENLSVRHGLFNASCPGSSIAVDGKQTAYQALGIQCALFFLPHSVPHVYRSRRNAYSELFRAGVPYGHLCLAPPSRIRSSFSLAEELPVSSSVPSASEQSPAIKQCLSTTLCAIISSPSFPRPVRLSYLLIRVFVIERMATISVYVLATLFRGNIKICPQSEMPATHLSEGITGNFLLRFREYRLVRYTLLRKRHYVLSSTVTG